MLDLSHNAITEISHMASESMTNLRFLSLENNDLVFLTSQVQHTFAYIPMLNLTSNNIYQLNMSSQRILSSITIDISRNNFTQLDLSPMGICSPPCGKVSFYVDDNLLTRVSLPCPATRQYVTVSFTQNWLTDFTSIFPNVSVQQCLIGTLNVSYNYFTHWSLVDYDSTISNSFYDILKMETHTHTIGTLDMTHCKITYVDGMVFTIFSIGFLDLRENAIHTLHAMYVPLPYPKVLNAQFNPIICNCEMKQYLKDMLKIKNEIFVGNCTELVRNISADINTVPDSRVMCKKRCPQKIHQVCNRGERCYKTDSAFNQTLNTAVCILSHKYNKLSSAFTTVLYQLHVSGFNLTILELPYVTSHTS